MKKAGLILLGVFLFLSVFWLGFMGNFPGAALSRLIEASIRRNPAVGARVAPAELGWSGIRFPAVALTRGSQEGARPLLALKDVTIPLTWRLWSGVPARGIVGKGGRFDLFLPWEGKSLLVNELAVRLEELPAVAEFKSVRLRGTVTASGSLNFPGGLTRSPLAPFPTGTISGKGVEVELRGLALLGSKIPVTRLEEVVFRIKSGRNIEFERFTFRGDLQGSINGTITPRASKPAASLLRLGLTASFRRSWLEGLGPFQAIVESFLTNGRLRADLRGTLGSPRLQKK